MKGLRLKVAKVLAPIKFEVKEVELLKPPVIHKIETGR